MADNDAPANPEPQTQQITQDPQVKAEDITPSKEDWKEIVGNKYASEADLAKAYKDLETKLGTQSEEIRKTREFAEVVNPLLEEIRNDPEIFKTLDEKLRKRSQPDNSQPEASKDVKDDRVDETRAIASDLILTRFEEKHGIDKLPDSERVQMRADIGKVIEQLTGKSFGNVDLRQLNAVLENAYLIANKDKLVNKEALIGATDASIPGIPSSSGKSEAGLTSEEARVAERLGLTRDQYSSGKIKN